MSFKVLKEFAYKDLQEWFANKMKLMGLNPYTIRTYKSDGLYVFRKEGSEVFWMLVESKNFENDVKDKIEEVLEKHSSGKIKANIASYVRALKIFRSFCLDKDEKIEDEYDVMVASEAYDEYIKSGRKSSPIAELWKKLD